MRKIFKSTLLWVIVGEVIVGIVLLLCGFRITYSPNLENSWDAVSAFAAWAGVIASTVAIFVAIQIPKKIAERQDKIALFEKRLTIYYTLYKCIIFAEMIKKDKNQIQIGLMLVFASYTKSDSKEQFELKKNEAFARHSTYFA